MINDAIQEAAAIIVVVQSSPKDLETEAAVEGLIQQAGLQDRTLYGINPVDRTSTLTKSAVETLRTKLARKPS